MNNYIIKKHIFTFFILIFFYGLLLSNPVLPGVLKYIIASLFMLFYFEKNITFFYYELYFFSLGVFPVLFSFFLCYIISDINPYAFKYSSIYLLIYLSPIAIATSYKRSAHYASDFFLITYIFSYLIIFILHKKISFIFGGISFTESTLSFSFGFLSLFYFSQKRYLNFLIALLFCVMAGKRIAIFSTVFSILYFFGLSFFSKKQFKILITIIPIIIFEFAYYLFFVHSDNFKFILRGNDNGRLFLYSLLPDIKVIGNGVGSAVSIVSNNFGFEFNLHSDSVQYLFDLGYLGFILYYFFIFYFLIKCSNFLSNYQIGLILSSLLYLKICGLTDNIHLYASFIFPFILIQHSAIYNSRNTFRGFACKKP